MTYRQTDRNTYIDRYIIDKQTFRQTNKQKYVDIDRQTDIYTDRQSGNRYKRAD